MPLIDHQPRVRPEPQTPLAQNSPQGRPPAWLVVAGVPTFTAFCCLLAWLAAHCAAHPGKIWMLAVIADVGIGVVIATRRTEIEL
jgi:hypothetical protein